jgi:endonuclease/exonuclease/phosphatase family metal-dependent hydrolase
MRIATWNVGGGFISTEQNLEFNTEDVGYFIGELKKIQPDVVCLQESHVSENNDQPMMMARALGFDFYKIESIADSHIKDGEKLSIAIISKYPIVSSKYLKLPHPNLYIILNGKKELCHDKGFLEVTINYQGNNFRVLSGHLVPFRKLEKDFLADEYRNIRDEVERIICDGNLPTVIGADMNFEDIDRLIPNVFQRGFRSILGDEVTTPKGRRYDKIILSDDWNFTNPKIIQGKADHYLCFADIDLKKE